MPRNTTALALGRYVLLTLAACAVVAAYRLLLHVNQTTVALTFLVFVLVVATRWRLSHAVYLSLLCTFLYNFYFLPPIGKLTISDPQNWVALLALLSASVLVSHLSNRERNAAELSERRRQEVERLYEFSERLLLQEEAGRLARLAPSMIAAVFHLHGVALYVEEEEVAYYSDPDDELVPVETLRRAGRGEEVEIRPGLRLVPLALGLRSSGALAMTEGEYSERIYEAIGGLVAIAMERASALARFSHLEASREGERLRSALLDSVAHELRTPLTAIRAAATSLVEQPSMGDDQRSELHSILAEESARLNHLIGQTVEMAQLDSESLQVRPRMMRLREVIDIVLEDMKPLLGGRPVVMDEDADQPAIAMDGELVRRVLRQLIENAAKYSNAASPITISSRLDQDRLLVSVSDQGPGISSTEIPFVFDKFFRGKHRVRVQGSGMGLAIAKAILHAHRGGIQVESRPGEGSTFTFWLPLRYEPEQAGMMSTYGDSA